MNRRDANRIAKQIFMAYGWQADAHWEETCESQDIDEKDMAIVRDYFVRCADRVSDWLNI